MKFYSYYIIGSFLLLSCTKEETFEFPIVQTGEVIQVDGTGVLFQAKIMSELSGIVIDHGFVWDTDSFPSLETGYSKMLGAAKAPLFSAKITSYFVSGREYFVRAYVATSDYLVYGRPVSFISKGGGDIKVSNFYPRTGTWGDTISIVHENISYKKGETKVFFGESLSEIISAKDSSIRVLVPVDLNHAFSQISITVADVKWVLQGQFNLLPMVIDDFMPKLVTFRDTVSILGKNFNPSILHNNIYLNGEKTTVVSCSPNILKVLVSDNIKNIEIFPPVKIIVGDLECAYNGLLQLKSPVIENFSPDKADRRDSLIVTGKFFNPTPGENKLFIGDVEAEIYSSTATELVANIPKGVIHGSNKLYVEVANTKVEAENEIFIYEPWQKLNDFPGGPRYGPFSYTTNGRAYIGGGSTGWAEVAKDLWEYDRDNDTWLKKSTTVSASMRGFTYESNSYHIDGYNLYKYDNFNDSRELISVCANASSANFIMVFVKGDIAYFINNNSGYAELWEYSFTKNSWSEQPKKLSLSLHGTVGFVNGDDVFYVSQDLTSENNLYKFDYSLKKFVEHLDLRGSIYLETVFEAQVFSIDNYSYIIDGHNMYDGSRFNRMVRYDKLTNTYIEILEPPFEARSAGIGFSIGGKGYCGLGSGNDRFSDIWEFDPDKRKPE